MTPGSKAFKQLIIIDPSLRGSGGHFLTYDLAVAEGAAEAGVATVVLADQRAQIRSAGFAHCFETSGVSTDLTNPGAAQPAAGSTLEVIPAFDLQLEKNFIKRRLQNLIPSLRGVELGIHRRRLAEGLARAAERIDQNTLLLFHTLTFRQIPGMVDWLESQPSERRPDVALLLRYSPCPHPYSPGPQDVDAYRAALAYLERSAVADRFTLLSDSERLIEEYRWLTRFPIHWVPIPHTVDLPACLPTDGPTDAAETSGKPITLTYLGNARSSKGFPLLGPLMQHLRPKLDSGQIRAEFQSNLMFDWDLPSKRSLEQLRSLRDSGLRSGAINLHEKELSTQEYQALLVRSDLVLIPYYCDWYHSQTSGVLSEAFAAAKPVVAPRGTWMADMVTKTGAGVLFPPGDPLGFLSAVEQAIGELDRLRARAQIARAEWRETHNPRRFYTALVEVVRRGASEQSQAGAK